MATIEDFINAVMVLSEYEKQDYSDKQPALIEREKHEELGKYFLKTIELFDLLNLKGD